MCLKDGIEKDGTGIRNDGKKSLFKKKKRKFHLLVDIFFSTEWKNIFSIPSFRLKDGIPSTK